MENVQENSLAMTQDENDKKWYSFSKLKGVYLLGTLVAVSAFGLSMQQPGPILEMDTQGVASYVRCSGSLLADSVDENACREYFEDYLSDRISKTDNLPRIVPLDIIGATYQSAQSAFKQEGFSPLKDLEVITQNKVQLLKSGKAISAS
ncbi:hypothetical protein I7Z51_002379 [Vibrio parahaemolyticus]|uniref:hypothetical protein n=1 Tax=Vibrio TaxID=662 RepID=UPI001A8D8647|nr:MULTISPECIES: hypothetical protein [Vibrio]EGQ7973457.1 hypothetical protein [Vibrio parahaemolyticus]MBO0208641.1 hypothetical protein [Vibrio sp. Vb0877]MCR9810896.1 hypothetical protein [Vibrio parahaemolyticus]MDW2322705.1 hypothetical protein [Vibrio sp. 1159]